MAPQLQSGIYPRPRPVENDELAAYELAIGEKRTKTLYSPWDGASLAPNFCRCCYAQVHGSIAEKPQHNHTHIHDPCISNTFRCLGLT